MFGKLKYGVTNLKKCEYAKESITFLSYQQKGITNSSFVGSCDLGVDSCGNGDYPVGTEIVLIHPNDPSFVPPSHHGDELSPTNRTTVKNVKQDRKFNHTCQSDELPIVVTNSSLTDSATAEFLKTSERRVKEFSERTSNNDKFGASSILEPSISEQRTSAERFSPKRLSCRKIIFLTEKQNLINNPPKTIKETKIAKYL